MAKWGALFGVVPLCAVVLFVVAELVGWSLPAGVSTFGRRIDFLYYLVLWVTGGVFVLTQSLLVYALWKFRGRRGRRATYSHGNRTAEIAWTVLPAIVLIGFGLAAIPVWLEMRFPSYRPEGPPAARVTGRQFEWRIVHAGPDGLYDTGDDLHTPNELHIARGELVWIHLTSMDVLHSFFLPHLRVKQDAVPGLPVAVWFDANLSTWQRLAQFADVQAGRDVQDVSALAEVVRQGETPATAVLRQALPEPVTRMLADWDPASFLTDAQRTTFLDGLTEAVAAGAVAEALRPLDGLSLNPLTLFLLQTPTGAKHPAVLGRMLLHAALPRWVAPIGGHYEIMCTELCGWGHSDMGGRLIVHDDRAELDQWSAWQRDRQEAGL